MLCSIRFYHRKNWFVQYIKKIGNLATMITDGFQTILHSAGNNWLERVKPCNKSNYEDTYNLSSTEKGDYVRRRIYRIIFDM